MKIRVKKERRKSVALSLSPEEVMFILPDFTAKPYTDVNKLLGALSNTEITQVHESIVKKEFRDLVNKWINKLQVKPKRVQLRKMKHKWASCSSEKNVVFNSLLKGMPREFVEYVICHDLLHLKVPRHNKLFRNLLSAYMPDWKERITRTIEFVLKREIGKDVDEIETLLDYLNSKVKLVN